MSGEDEPRKHKNVLQERVAKEGKQRGSREKTNTKEAERKSIGGAVNGGLWGKREQPVTGKLDKKNQWEWSKEEVEAKVRD